MHLIAGDSFVNMSDGNPLYTFGFGNQTGTDPANVIGDGILDAEWPGPTVELEEGQEFYLSLTNVGTVIRPDLFDPHTVHFHGFPNAATVFDGVPEVSISINMGATLTYYYNIVEPGTYIYHCHVEATEHMEMGMLANLYVHPAQDVTGYDVDGSGEIDATELASTQATRKGGAAGNPGGYTYNDGDGTTGFDVEEPIQVSSMDSNFHDASLFVQPLPFALLESTYPQINGRGYPDTVISDALPAPKDDADGKVTGVPCLDSHTDPTSTCEPLNNGTPTQTLDSVITVGAGEKLLLRLSNVSIDRFYTLTAQGLPMQIVGTGARQMRGVTGKNLYRDVASVNFGGGETHDVIIDTTGVAPGTYFLYSTELHQMSNLTQLDGGMITEIVVN
jgi:FtsP/CotA-like multicopper oxidase with cupredoxin domain